LPLFVNDIDGNGRRNLHLVSGNRIRCYYRSQRGGITNNYSYLYYNRYRRKWMCEHSYKNGIGECTANYNYGCRGDNMRRQLYDNDRIWWQHLLMVSGYKLIGNNRRNCNRFAYNYHNLYGNRHKR